MPVDPVKTEESDSTAVARAAAAAAAAAATDAAARAASAAARADGAANRADAAAVSAAIAADRLEDKVQAIAVDVAASGAKLDAVGSQVATLVTVVKEHIDIHAGDKERIAVLEIRTNSREADRAKRQNIILAIVGVVGGLIATGLGAFLSYYFGP